MSLSAWIDELERDLGLTARIRLVANAGGQRRNIPTKRRAARSQLAHEVGADIVVWLAERFAQTAIDIPSPHSHEQRDRASNLRAAILDAGLTKPIRSANDIATEFGVTAAWVHKLRAQLRDDLDISDQLWLPFDRP